MNHFDFINSITYNKEDLFEDPLASNDYNSFMVNRGLSYYPDTLFYANEMNQNYQLDKDMQFKFLINTISKRKRFSKWAKKQKEPKEIEVIASILNCSFRKALDYLELLTDAQLKILLQSQYKGGKS